MVHYYVQCLTHYCIDRMTNENNAALCVTLLVCYIM